MCESNISSFGVPTTKEILQHEKNSLVSKVHYISVDVSFLSKPTCTECIAEADIHSSLQYYHDILTFTRSQLDNFHQPFFVMCFIWCDRNAVLFRNFVFIVK